jgi:hypothetical protein
MGRRGKQRGAHHENEEGLGKDGEVAAATNSSAMCDG